MTSETLLSCLKFKKDTTGQALKVAPSYMLEEPKKENKIWTFEVITTKDQKKFQYIEKYDSLDKLTEELKMYVAETGRAGRKRKNDETNFTLTQPSCTYVSESCLHGALQKCMNVSKFWSKDGLEYLISSDYITKGLQGTMFNCIFHYDATDLLKTTFLHIKNISEKFVVKSLKHVIRSVDKSEIDKLSLTLTWDGCPVDQTVARELLYIIPVSFNETTMKDYMKLLTADEALVLLQFLHYILTIVSPALISNCITDLSIPKDITEVKVFGWIDCLLTAHMLTFSTSPTLKQLIPQLKKTLWRQKYFYRDIATLAPYLEHFKNNIKLPKKVSGKYTIETITL